MDVSSLLEEFNKLQEGGPAIDEVGSLEGREVLEVVMGKGLAEMHDKMFDVGVSFECESVGLFLFGYSLAIDTVAHNVVEVLDGDGAEVEDFNDFNFQVH